MKQLTALSLMREEVVAETSITSAWARVAMQIRRAQVQDAVKIIQDHLRDSNLEFALITPFNVSFTEVGEISDKGIVPFDPDADMTPAERVAAEVEA